MLKGPWTVSILHCVDGTYYVGFTNNLETRLQEHRQGINPAAYTYRRRPLRAVGTEAFPDHDEAFRIERQIKAWSHAKEAALITGGVARVHEVVHNSKRAGPFDFAQATLRAEGAKLKRR